jgi:hypothetical protein
MKTKAKEVLPPSDRVTVYAKHSAYGALQWYWHSEEGGRIVGDGSEGYARRFRASRQACFHASPLLPVWRNELTGKWTLLRRPLMTRNDVEIYVEDAKSAR